jgi:hypothetical protein
MLNPKHTIPHPSNGEKRMNKEVATVNLYAKQYKQPMAGEGFSLEVYERSLRF